MTTDAVPHGTPEPAAQADPAQGVDPATTPPPSEPAQTDWEAEAKKWEKRAKENGAKAKQFDTERQASMSEAEKAVAEAEKRGRTAATSEFSQRLVRSEFDALAGRRNPDVKTDEVLEYIDLAKFVGEDGEPDSKAIQAAVERLVPEAAGQAARPPGFDSGSRTPPPKQSSMSDRIRQQAGRAT